MILLEWIGQHGREGRIYNGSYTEVCTAVQCSTRHDQHAHRLWLFQLHSHKLKTSK
jgi:hypothetical protein